MTDENSDDIAVSFSDRAEGVRLQIAITRQGLDRLVQHGKIEEAPADRPESLGERLAALSSDHIGRVYIQVVDSLSDADDE
jgi:hypothetical protein